MLISVKTVKKMKAYPGPWARQTFVQVENI